MKKLMKEQKTKSESQKKECQETSPQEACSTAHKELYLEHLMGMTVGLLGHGFQKS